MPPVSCGTVRRPAQRDGSHRGACARRIVPRHTPAGSHVEPAPAGGRHGASAGPRLDGSARDRRPPAGPFLRRVGRAYPGGGRGALRVDRRGSGRRRVAPCRRQGREGFSGTPSRALASRPVGRPAWRWSLTTPCSGRFSHGSCPLSNGQRRAPDRVLVGARGGTGHRLAGPSSRPGPGQRPATGSWHGIGQPFGTTERRDSPALHPKQSRVTATAWRDLPRRRLSPCCAS